LYVGKRESERVVELCKHTCKHINRSWSGQRAPIKTLFVCVNNHGPSILHETQPVVLVVVVVAAAAASNAVAPRFVAPARAYVASIRGGICTPNEDIVRRRALLPVLSHPPSLSFDLAHHHLDVSALFWHE
jgi:hypothetical protein